MCKLKPPPVYRCIEKVTGATSDIIQAHSVYEAGQVWQKKILQNEDVTLYDVAKHRYEEVKPK